MNQTTSPRAATIMKMMPPTFKTSATVMACCMMGRFSLRGQQYHVPLAQRKSITSTR